MEDTSINLTHSSLIKHDNEKMKEFQSYHQLNMDSLSPITSSDVNQSKTMKTPFYKISAKTIIQTNQGGGSEINCNNDPHFNSKHQRVNKQMKKMRKKGMFLQNESVEDKYIASLNKEQCLEEWKRTEEQLCFWKKEQKKWLKRQSQFDQQYQCQQKEKSNQTTDSNLFKESCTFNIEKITTISIINP